jgi:hypothetical protein
MRIPAVALAASLVLGCGGDGSGDPTGDGGVDAAPPIGAGGPYFPPGGFWDRDVSASAPAANSDAIIASLRAAGGWGNGDRFQIDFSFDVLRVDGASPAKRTFTPTEDFYEPDCDHVPDAGAARRQPRGRGRLRVYRRRRLPPAGVGARRARCTRCGAPTSSARTSTAAAWRCGTPAATTARPAAASSAPAPTPPASRSRRCCSPPTRSPPARSITPSASSCPTTACAAATCGRRPTAPTPPATRTRRTTACTSGCAPTIRWRRCPTEGARVVARALQRYGMYHADGGHIALTAQSDRYTTAQVGRPARAPRPGALQVEDFEVIDHGPPIDLTFDCVRE